MQNDTFSNLMNINLLKNLDFLEDKNLSLNTKFDLFYQNVSSNVDQHAPTTKVNKKDLKLHEKPWITFKIRKLIKYRDRLLRKLNKIILKMVNICIKSFEIGLSVN